MADELSELPELPTEQAKPDAYSEDSFWKKLSRYALIAGEELVFKVLCMYYALVDPDTPKSAKLIIMGALGYFILPLDAIPDFLPGVGYADDLSAIGAAMATVMMHIKEEHKQKADEQLDKWFPS